MQGKVFPFFCTLRQFYYEVNFSSDNGSKDKMLNVFLSDNSVEKLKFFLLIYLIKYFKTLERLKVYEDNLVFLRSTFPNFSKKTP